MISLIGYMATSFLFGSIPFGYLLSRIVSKTDIRKSGSGNIGATNVTRVLGIKFGLVSFIFDFLKGFLPYWIASRWLFQGTDTSTLLWISIAPILGHNFSPFLSFKGGKGISTTAGLLIAFHPIVGLLSLLVWTTCLVLFGYVSLASIAALLLAPILFLIFETSLLAAFLALVAIAMLGIFQHRSNIQRLFNGTEKKMLKRSLF